MQQQSHMQALSEQTLWRFIAQDRGSCMKKTGITDKFMNACAKCRACSA